MSESPQRWQEALLNVVAVLQLSPEAEVRVSVHGLTREEYDALPGRYEVTVGEGQRLLWTKDINCEGLQVELFTAEPPRTQVVSKVTPTRRNLKLMTE